jgi:hypothetical protein
VSARGPISFDPAISAASPIRYDKRSISFRVGTWHFAAASSSMCSAGAYTFGESPDRGFETWLIAQRQSFVGIYPHEQTACEWLRVRQRDVNNGAVASPAHLQAALFEHLQDCAVAGQDFGDQLIETGLARDR